MKIICLSLYNWNYITTDITIPLVIYDYTNSILNKFIVIIGF